MKRFSFLRQPPSLVLGAILVLLPLLSVEVTIVPSVRVSERSLEIGAETLEGGSGASNFPASGEPQVPTNDRANDWEAAGSSAAGAPAAPTGSELSPAAASTDFSLDFRLVNPLQRLNLLPTKVSQSGLESLDALFVGDSYSLVAKAVGSAEGTRTPEGGYTSAFVGHTDPGNGVWNLGTFSYQHGAASPEEADRKQLQRLWKQASEMRRRAELAGITLDLEAELNGIDLANQSPLAALGRPDGYPGYVAWLAEAQRQGLRGREAILWARVQGYWNVSKGQWNAPGLGNTEPLIRRDQNRRMEAIARAIQASPVPTVPAMAPTPQPNAPIAVEPIRPAPPAPVPAIAAPVTTPSRPGTDNSGILEF